MSAKTITSKSWDDKHELKFELKRHIYWLDDVIVSGVTTVNKKGGPIAQALLNWYISQGKKSKDIADKAADIGKIVHSYAEHHSKGTLDKFDFKKVEAHPSKLVINRCIEKYKDFAKKEEASIEEIYGHELLVAAPSVPFGGTIDRAIKHKRWGVTIEDYKTSKGFFAEQFIQGAAYAKALKEWRNLDVDSLRINLFTKSAGDIHTLVVNDGKWYYDNAIIFENFTIQDLYGQFSRNFDAMQLHNKIDSILDPIYRELNPWVNNKKK